MKISVTVKTNSRKESIKKEEDGSFLVKVNAPPIDGKANKKTVELLSKYFSIPKSKIKLVIGHKSKKKIFQVFI